MNSTTDDGCGQLNEHQLRQLYDEEEAEDFLRFFSTYVTEVRVPDNPNEGRDDSTNLARIDQGNTGRLDPNLLLSETVALNFIVPLLPPANISPPPPFTISRCRLAVQRLYLALEPLYYPFIVDLINLSTWTNRSRSMKYCLIFWTLWWLDLLLPSLFLRLLYSLIRRRIFTYPTYAELVEHRHRVDKAAEIGDNVSAQLTKSTDSLQDSWKMYKLCLSFFRRSETLGKAKAGDSNPDLDENLSALDDLEDGERIENLKRDALHVLNQIADFHERVKNIFIWRQPISSGHYGTLLLLMFLLTLLIPAHYLTKFAYFCCGFMFWHIVPVVTALPPGCLSRIPPPLVDVPTNAECAMQLISRRIADGHPVTPQKPVKAHPHSPSEMPHEQNQGASKISILTPTWDRVDWSKWGNRMAMGKSWAIQRRQLISGRVETNSPNPINTSVNGETHAYPAQCGTTTGLLTVTPNVLYFTPAISTSAKIEIPFLALRSVKKSDMLTVKGLKVRWFDALSSSEQEEYFLWVGGRDELFARLIGHGGGRWSRV